MRLEVAINAAFLERLRRRDFDAFAEAVRDRARRLLRAARASGFAQPEAEDMVQDVFTTFLERLDSFEGRSQLRAWLFGILPRKALELRRASIVNDRFVLREVEGFETGEICKILDVSVTNFGCAHASSACKAA
jgi:RNA polymerase sigma-70 factor (ECF subfamily)